MSLILDALQKAEADRKLGQTVGLHDPAPLLPPPTTDRFSWVKLLVIALLIGLLAVLFSWLWLKRETSTALPDAQSETMIQNTAAINPAPAVYKNEFDTVQIPQPAKKKPKAPASEPLASQNLIGAQNKTISPPIENENSTPPLLRNPEARASLPPLIISGAVYAEAPSSRMVVINGQVFHEGETIEPGLILESIRLKSAVFLYRGQRYLHEY